MGSALDLALRRYAGDRESANSRTAPSRQLRIEPRGRDVYNRLVADVFVNEQNVAEPLILRGIRKAAVIETAKR